MTQNEKELLMKDLCARLLYGVKVSFRCNHIHILKSVLGSGLTLITETVTNVNTTTDVENIKPYLFPLSSMTEEQKNECFNGTPLGIDKYGDVAVKDDFFGNSLYTDLEIYLEVIDWLLKNHFDIYGLIDKNLAIDATNLNIY